MARRRVGGNTTVGNRSRHPQDFYPTDPRWTRVLLDNIPLRGTVWEPAAGDGAMADVIREYGYEVLETDIVTGTDFLTSDNRAESIVTNPPYRLLNEFVLKGLEQTDGILALLVGWHLLSGGSKRVREVWDPRPPSRILVIPERMVVNGSASQFNHAWVVWDKLDARDNPALSWHFAKE